LKENPGDADRFYYKFVPSRQTLQSTLGHQKRLKNQPSFHGKNDIGATQYLSTFPMSADMYLPGYLAVIVNDENQTKIYETFPEKIGLNNCSLVLDDPSSPSWEEFSWYTVENGIIINIISPRAPHH